MFVMAIFPYIEVVLWGSIKMAPRIKDGGLDFIKSQETFKTKQTC